MGVLFAPCIQVVFCKGVIEFCTKVYDGQIWSPVVFDDAALSVPSFIGSKVMFWLLTYIHSTATIFHCFFFFDIQVQPL